MMFFSDVFGTSATRVLDRLIELGHSNFDVAPLLHKSCKATPEQVKAALDGEFSFPPANRVLTPEQAFALLRKQGFTIAENAV